MMNFKKLMSLFLAVLMLCGVMASLSVIPVSAADAAEGEGESSVEEVTSVESLYTEIYASPEEKLATMKLMTTKGNYSIYAKEASGEVAVKDLSTGQVLFTNPYDIGAATASDSVKNEILSQIIVKFDENGRERVYSSFEYAAMRDQIKVKNIKNGIRVEYTIGREEARRLVPRMIEKSRFETLIKAPMEEYYGVTYEEAQELRYQNKHPLAAASFYLCKQMSYFVYKSKADCTSDRLLQDLLDAFPIVDKMDIYVLDKAATTTEIEKIEEVIKTACPNYSYEEMDYDHQLTEYTGEEENPPVFKMALEYTLDKDGFSVRLPANGIRFNESKFQLTNVSVLPYMGAGNNTYNGYTFYPDGSGALFAFEDLADQNTYTVASKIYGVDYAYHQISGTYQQTVRYPVFGIVENTEYYDCLYINEEEGVEEIVRISSMIYDKVLEAQKEGQTNALVTKYGGIVSSSDAEKVDLDRGYVAIIEEGDALTELVTYHAGVLSPYDTVQMNFNPRPKDSYNIADAISVGSNSEWTVVSNRKYVGNYKIHYVMLSDEDQAAKNNLKADEWYESSWLGMAKAYRDYLVGNGVLSQLEQTSDDIPLYIESFGAVETVEKFMSIPVEVMKPLTSTEDIKTMYKELYNAGATNINFKLTGFANGGVYYSSMPYKLKWEKAVQQGLEEDISMQELFDFAASEENLTLFPEFEFSYQSQMADKLFDGFSSRKHAVRTIDDRFTSERPYMATQQKYSSSFRLAVSPAYYEYFYTELMDNYLSYNNVSGISVGSLGNALNSDFDEDEPYNREDSKAFISKALQYISGTQDNMDVMVVGGNAYTWQYVDHILGAALDSSRYIKASYSVPFVGVVLHGYMNFAGSPLNMEGDVNYAKLKAIENGASIYFTLSYQNTQILKEDINLSKYYSIRYDIWYDDVVEIYNELNSATKDVQNKIIVDHEFLSGMRVPDVDELDRDTDEILNSIKDFLDNKAEYEALRKRQEVADARDNIASLESAAQTFVKNFMAYYVGGADGRGSAAETYMGMTYNRSFAAYYASYVEAKAAYDAILAEYEAASAEEKAALETALVKAEKAAQAALVTLRSTIRKIGYGIDKIQSQSVVLEQMLKDAETGKNLIDSIDCPESIKLEIKQQLANAQAMLYNDMGLDFTMTIDRGEIDTVLRTHIATLLLSAYGETSDAGYGMVGKAENLYEMLVKGEVGLRADEVDLLRYLSANKKKTDAQLLAEYQIPANGSSMEALVRLVRELLGESYEFDPVVEFATNGVDTHIRQYILDSVNKTIGSTTNLVPGLNFTSKYPNEDGRLLDNKKNNERVQALVDDAINKVIYNNITGFGSVTSGKYDFDALFTDEQIDALIADCIKIIKSNIRDEKNNPALAIDKSVAYKDVEAKWEDLDAYIAADLRAYIEGTFYRKAIDKQFPLKLEDPAFAILGTADKTDASINLLVALASVDYYADKFNTKDGYDVNKHYYTNLFAEIRKEITTATDVHNILDAMNDLVDEQYGNSLTDLQNAYIKALANSEDFFEKDLSKATAINASEHIVNGVSLRERVVGLVKEALPTLTLANIDAFIAYLQDDIYHGEYGMNHAHCEEKGHDVALLEYVYYSYFSYMKTLEVPSFYYDDQLATIDVAVATKVASMKAEISAKLPAGYTVYDIYDLVMTALADTTNSVYDFTDPLAAGITHVYASSANKEKDVLDYYIYELLNSFDEHVNNTAAPQLSLGYYDNSKTVDELYELIVTGNRGSLKWDKNKYADFAEILKTTMTEKNYIKQMIDVVRSKSAVGALPNYSMASLDGEIDIDAIVEDLYKALVSSKKLAKHEQTEDFKNNVLLPELENYLAYQYYSAVIAERLKVVKQPEFHVSEVYSGNLAETTNELEALMIYFVTNGTDMTADDVRSLYTTNVREEEETEDEESRYLSDDGRIVAVTYGDKNSDGSYTAYKTFILNYNNFAVSVEYAGVTYTIPAYGKVIVMHG